ncbi:MAG: FAD-binding oxidoreductase [Pseudooceanicola sp.]|jgi:FAD/FMN-containing dehydrogenase|nr:FAD-binding oxidoreductase [Pseudooceanicola sp.]
MTDSHYEALGALLGRGGVLRGADIGPRYFTDWRGEGPVRPELVLRPATTEEMSQILAYCHRESLSVAVQGGMTGLVRGAVPQPGEVVIATDRMTAVAAPDVAGRTIVAEAGAPLQAVQEAAEAAGLFFPLDLGARGSCTIGGNIATNAGGNRVIRYGMTRDLVLGLEAVQADGTVIDAMGSYIKNNTGYDLKQMFIGSEGTLGIMTRAVLRLFPRPQSQAVAYCGLDSFDAVVAFLAHMQTTIGASLSAFEVLWSATYDAICEKVPQVRAALPRGHRFYVLTEMMGSDGTRDPERFEEALGQALEQGLMADAVVSKSDAEVRALWELRDGMAHAMGAERPIVSFDISLAVSDMADLEQVLTDRLRAHMADPMILIGGHLGDGNLHLAVRANGVAPEDQPLQAIEREVYALVGARRGSVSAEHGIGLSKRAYLPQSRSPQEIAMMRSMKAALDPKGILNQGRIFG